MFTPVDYDFNAGHSLSDYGMEPGSAFPPESITFEGEVLKLQANKVVGCELIMLTTAPTGTPLQIKVKNAKGHAATGTADLISNQFVPTTTGFKGAVIIFINPGESFEFTGYSLIAAE